MRKSYSFTVSFVFKKQKIKLLLLLLFMHLNNCSFFYQDKFKFSQGLCSRDKNMGFLFCSTVNRSQTCVLLDAL